MNESGQDQECKSHKKRSWSFLFMMLTVCKRYITIKGKVLFVQKKKPSKSLEARRSDLGLLANGVEESSVDVLGQVSGLQRTTLLLVCETRALSGDGTATKSNESKGL